MVTNAFLNDEDTEREIDHSIIFCCANPRLQTSVAYYYT